MQSCWENVKSATARMKRAMEAGSASCIVTGPEGLFSCSIRKRPEPFAWVFAARTGSIVVRPRCVPGKISNYQLKPRMTVVHSPALSLTSGLGRLKTSLTCIATSSSVTRRCRACLFPLSMRLLHRPCGTGLMRAAVPARIYPPARHWLFLITATSVMAICSCWMRSILSWALVGRSNAHG